MSIELFSIKTPIAKGGDVCFFSVCAICGKIPICHKRKSLPSLAYSKRFTAVMKEDFKPFHWNT